MVEQFPLFQSGIRHHDSFDRLPSLGSVKNVTNKFQVPNDHHPQKSNIPWAVFGNIHSYTRHFPQSFLIAVYYIAYCASLVLHRQRTFSDEWWRVRAGGWCQMSASVRDRVETHRRWGKWTVAQTSSTRKTYKLWVEWKATCSTWTLLNLIRTHSFNKQPIISRGVPIQIAISPI